jgi:DNA-binding transcriptional MerR regulator
MEFLLSVADASRVLGVTPATIRLLARRGILRIATRTQSGIRLFRRADVERLAARRAETARSKAALVQRT